MATAVADPRILAALTAYDIARTDGLCHDGAWECAVVAGHGCSSAIMADDEQMRQTLWSLVHG
jgi:hypothetical protein